MAKVKPIRIYEYNTTSFNNNGLGVLFPSDAIIERNLSEMTYSLSIIHPLDEYGKWELLQEDRIIKANEQLFRIKYVTKTLTSIEAYCEHIFFDLQNNFIEDTNIVNKNGNLALNQILDAMVYDHPFPVTATSDISIVNNSRLVRKNVLTAIIGSDDNSFINRWGGELDIDGFTFCINSRIGQNRGYKISYGKNLTGLDAQFDMTNVCTVIRPIGFDGIELPDYDKYVYSQYVDNYAMPIIREYKYEDVKWVGSPNYQEPSDGTSDAYQTLEEAQSELRRRAEMEFTENKIDIPSATYNINFIELSQTEEYKDYQSLAQINIGDDVTITHKRLGIDIPARCISYKYNCLTANFDEITLGYYNRNFFSKTMDVINESEFIQTLPDKLNDFLQQSKDYATEILMDGFGGYVYVTPNAIFLMDTNDINTAQSVAVLNMNGLGFSNTGINGTFETAITRDGHIVADFIDTGILNAQLVKSGILESLNGKSWINMETGDFNLGDKVSYENGVFKISVSSSDVSTSDGSSLNDKLDSIDNAINDITDSVTVEISGEQVFIEKDGIITPSSITLNAIVENTTDTGKWQYYDNINWVDLGETNKTLNVIPITGLLATSNAMRIRYIVGTIYDEMTIVKLIDGKNGQTTYLHIKYSDDGGQTFTANNGETLGSWIGTYTDFTKEDSSDVSYYLWKKFVGENGKDGTSVSIKGSYTQNEWNNTWQSLVHNATNGDGYLVDGNLYVFDGVTFTNCGSIKGETGEAGKSSYLHIKYSNDGGTTFTNNDGETVGDWMGTYVDNESSDSANVSRYTWKKIVGEDGVNGKDGISSYIHIKYSNDGGSTFTSNNGETIGDYIGTYVDSIETDSTDISRYMWKKFVGEDGIDGVNGDSSYLHIKYSNDGGATFTANNGETVGNYIGTYVDFVKVDSSDVTKYTWKKFVGENGVDGKDGSDAYTIILTNENHTFPCDYSGNIPSAITITTQILAFKGTTQVAPTIGTLPTVTGLSLSKNSTNSTITIVANSGYSLSDNGTFTIPVVVDGITFNRTFSWSKSKAGLVGSNGEDGYTVLLTNENYTFIANSTGNIETTQTTTTNILVYKGAKSVAFTIGTLPTVSGLTLSSNGNVVTIQANTGTNLALNGTFDIIINADGKSFIKTFSWSKSLKGLDGADGADGAGAKTIDIIASSQVFKSTDGGETYTPDTITLSPALQNIIFSKWQYSVDGGTTWLDVVSGEHGFVLNGSGDIIEFYGNIVVSQKSLSFERGTTQTFNVNLASAPTSNQVVTISATGCTVDKTSLIFTPSNYNTTQTVTVSGSTIGNGTITLSSSNVNSKTINVAITQLTTSAVYGNIVPSVSSLSFTSGSSATFSVKLDKVPTNNQIVNIYPNGCSVSTSSLTFNPTNYNTYQTVTVSGTNVGTCSIALSSSNVSTQTIEVVISSNTSTNTYGNIVLNKTTSTIQQGSTDTFTVKLDHAPTNNQIVSLSTSNNNISLDKNSLTFTPINYSTAQTVKVTGSNIGTTKITVSSPYVSNQIYSVTVTEVAQNVTYGDIVLSKTSSTITTGSTDTFTVKLNKAPTNSQTVTLSTDNANATINKTSLTFTSSNYSTDQTITITGTSSGTTIITASSPNVSSKSVSVVIDEELSEYVIVDERGNVLLTDDDYAIKFIEESVSSSGGSTGGGIETTSIVTANQGFNTDGSLDGKSSFTHTETYIPFSGNTDATIQFGTSGWTRAIFYDSNKTRIGYTDSTSAVTSLSMSELQSKSPNAVYVRVSINQTTTITLVSSTASVMTMSLNDIDAQPISVESDNGKDSNYAIIVGTELTISKFSDLFTDTVTSIVFKALTTDQNIYDTITVLKLHDSTDIDVEGMINSAVNPLIEANEFLTKRMDNAFGDGVITTYEKINMKTDLKEIDAQYEDITKIVNLYNNSSLTGIYNEYKTAYDNLHTILYPVLSDMNSDSIQSVGVAKDAFLQYGICYSHLRTALDTYIDNNFTNIQTKITTMSDSVDIAVTKSTSNEQQINTISKHMSFSDNGWLELYADNNGQEGRFKTQITDTKMAFLDSNSEVAYMSNQKLYINQAEVVNEMKIGNIVITISDLGGLIFSWDE